jgi:heterodisulfide reductase subunit B
VKDAVDRGAKAIIVACPMCQSNLDMRRPHIDSYLKMKTDIPAMYITQAIGLAVGIGREELGLKKLFITPSFA